jgi:hypothetical protein
MVDGLGDSSGVTSTGESVFLFMGGPKTCRLATSGWELFLNKEAEMDWLKTTLVILVLAGVGLFASCDSSPSAPDIDVVTPDTTGAVIGSSSGLSVGDPSYGRGNGALGTVFVTSQGLYYDTFVTAEELPPRGPFQLLVDGVTEYGPGDPGYVGGRWKVPDGEGGFRYFLCPLLPPGREAP